VPGEALENIMMPKVLKAADLNQMLHERGVDKNIKVQKICTGQKRIRSERSSRTTLD